MTRTATSFVRTVTARLLLIPSFALLAGLAPAQERPQSRPEGGRNRDNERRDPAPPGQAATGAASEPPPPREREGGEQR